jgi:Flp pilus assembly protein TadG
MSFKFRLWKEESGQAIVMFAIGFVVLLGFTALAVDIGSVASEKSNLQNAADAAALAGAQELPANPEKAKLIASQYALANGKAGDQVVGTEVSGDDLIITVTIEREVNGYFSQFLGIDSNDVAAKATAKVTPNVTPQDMITTTTEDSGDPVGGVSGVIPLGVEAITFNYGELYTLKEGGGNAIFDGNYGGLQLGKAGESNFETNIRDGYLGPLSVGDKIFTETGNMAAANSAILERISKDPTATFETVLPGSPRLVTIIVVETMEVNGHKEVTIVGFAVFFLESGDGKVNGHYQITGRFKEMVVPNSTPGTGTDYGAHAPITTTTTTTTYTTTYTFPQLIN